MTTQKQPKAEWGRYAITPRIVRTQYKDLTHAEKWLYTCLKDLCGDKGVCYRTLRSLSEETDISTGSLSTMIPHLHKAGLIHAEKKRRSTNPTAKEVWHITIVDIWQANVEECSKNEQSQENVQNLNEVAGERSADEQQCSNSEPKRSVNEPKRSDFVDRRRVTEEEEKKESEVSVTASTSPNETAAPAAHTHSCSSQEKTPTRSGAKQSPPPGKTPVKSEHSAEAETLRALYDSIALGTGKTSGHPRWDWTALEEMVAAHPTEEEIRLVYAHLKANQKKCTIQAVWENWSALGTLKKPVFSNSSPPRSTVVDEEPDRPFLKPSDTHKSRYGALAAVGGGR